MTRISIDSGRYVPVKVNGATQWIRSQVSLRAEIVALLDQMGGLPKKRIIMTLSTTQAAVEQALATLLSDGTIEHYRARSVRGRMDEHWCITGKAPAAPLASNSSRYNAIAILTAMQQHAATLNLGVQQ